MGEQRQSPKYSALRKRVWSKVPKEERSRRMSELAKKKHEGTSAEERSAAMKRVRAGAKKVV